jgi:hypothetical protein
VKAIVIFEKEETAQRFARLLQLLKENPGSPLYLAELQGLLPEIKEIEL